MTRTAILPAFLNYPAEAAIIGRLLAGYADLEIGMLHCVSVVREDFDTSLKVMFRDRGENRRINISLAKGPEYIYQAALSGGSWSVTELHMVLVYDVDGLARCLQRAQKSCSCASPLACSSLAGQSNVCCTSR